MLDLLMLITHKQSYVTVMPNKRRYSNEMAVFNMSTVILRNTFKTTTPLVEATVKWKFWIATRWLSLSSVISLS